MNLLRSVLFLLFLFASCLLAEVAIAARTELRKTANGFELLRDGQPYKVNGVGGQVNLDLAVRIGANSIRTWGIDDAQQILDEAQQKGLTVMLGFWLQHERHGFDYNDTVK
ncbi:MAG: hypothetical protein ACKO1U_01050, partial [Bacteroidota bacterium]